MKKHRLQRATALILCLSMLLGQGAFAVEYVSDLPHGMADVQTAGENNGDADEPLLTAEEPDEEELEDSLQTDEEGDEPSQPGETNDEDNLTVEQPEVGNGALNPALTESEEVLEPSDAEYAAALAQARAEWDGYQFTGLPFFMIEDYIKQLDTTGMDRAYIRLIEDQMSVKSREEERFSLEIDGLIQLLGRSDAAYNSFDAGQQETLEWFFDLETDPLLDTVGSLEQTVLAQTAAQNAAIMGSESFAAMPQADSLTDAAGSPLEDTPTPERTLSAPFKHDDNITEQVSMANGALNYTVTDAVVPGVNGLDLVIARRYSTDDARYYEPESQIVYRELLGNRSTYPSFYAEEQRYRYERGTDGYPTNNREDVRKDWGNSWNRMSSRAYWDLGTRSGFSGGTTDFLLHDVYFAGYESPQRYWADFTENKRVPAKIYETNVSLGTGWRFCFSSVRQRGFGYELTLADGSVYTVSEWQISGMSNLQQHVIGDIKFSKDTSYKVGTETSAYKVEYADGKAEYFNYSGELIAIADRFGNAIHFVYTTVNGLKECTITDSTGQVTRIYNEIVTNGYNTKIALPDGSTVTLQNVRNAARAVPELEAPYYPNWPKGSLDSYNLTKAIDQQGNATTYAYTDTACLYSLNARMDLSKEPLPHEQYDNYAAALKTITYPTGYKANYEYRVRWYDWGPTGLQSNISIKKRYDTIGSTKYNQRNYNYWNGYTNSSDDTTIYYYSLGRGNYYFHDYYGEDFIATETDVDRNIKTEYSFCNVSYIHTGTKVYSGNKLVRETKPEYFQKVYLTALPSKITETVYGNPGSGSYSLITLYDYDSRGNAVAVYSPLAEGNRNNTEYKTTLEYHPVYNYVTKKTYKTDAGTTVIEQATPASNGKTITQSTVTVNGTVQEKQAYTYDSYGNVTRIRQYPNPSASQTVETRYTYDKGAFLTAITVPSVQDADGASMGSIEWKGTYDKLGRLLTETDPEGNLTKYTYNKIGDLTRVDYADGTYETYVYNYTANTVTHTDPRGTVLVYGYNSAGYLATVKEGSNVLKSLTYDGSFRVKTESNNQSADSAATVTYTYDYRDRLLSQITTGKTGTVAQETYAYADGTGSQNVVTKTIVGGTNNPNIVTKEYYDKYGRLVKTGRMLGSTEYNDTFTYDYVGNVITDKTARDAARAFTNQYAYNYRGQVVKQTDALGKFETMEYDGLGRMVSATDKNGNTRFFTYDALSRQLTRRVPVEGSVFSESAYYYDGNSNVTKETITSGAPGSAEKRITEYWYDVVGQLTDVKAGSGSEASYVHYTYDKGGNLTGQYTGLTAKYTPSVSGYSLTAYDYDRFGNMTALTDPLGRQETYAYDLNGFLTQSVDRNGAVTTNTYNGAGLLLNTCTQDADSSISTAYTYGLTGTPVRIEQEGYTLQYTYDALGRLTRETETGGIVKQYHYDNGDNRTLYNLAVNGKAVQIVEYTYDALNRLETIVGDDGNPTKYTYDPVGNRTGLTYGNGVTVSYAYNRANWVTELENRRGNTLLSSYRYSYLLDGNQSEKTDHTGRTTRYVYDSAGRLSAEQESGASDAVSKIYGYDPAGNRAIMEVSGAERFVTDYQYDANNRLLTETKTEPDAETRTVYRYDPNGNEISQMTSVLAAAGTAKPEIGLTANTPLAVRKDYDLLGRLTAVTNETGTARYTYRPDGLRSSKTVGGSRTDFIWDGQNMVAELNGGTVTDSYLFGVGLIYSDRSGYYTFNAHGDVTGLTDTSGTLTQTYHYDAFGVERDPREDDPNPYRYAGEYFDRETGDIYLRARFYNASIGRFSREDPIRDGLNYYTYCFNSPVGFVDPSGLKSISLRSAIENLGGTVSWDNKSRRATVYLDGRTVQVYEGDGNGSYIGNNGKMYTDDAWLFFALSRIYDVGKGWTVRKGVDATGINVGRRYIHVEKGSEHYAQNDDGSPHDGLKGAPPKAVRKRIKEQMGWDWDQKDADWNSKIKIDYDISGITTILYPNGRSVRVIQDPVFTLPVPGGGLNVRDYYYGPTTVDLRHQNVNNTIIVPTPGPITVPVPIPTPIPVPILP